MRNFIKCPYCGYEYVPSEIYYPDSFLCKPTSIYRDVDGKIEKVNAKPCLEEHYICDNCDKTFKVKATINYASSKVEELDFDNDYISPLYQNRITLEE